MPVVPELRQVGAQVRVVEVLRQFESQRAANGQGDIGVAAEVKIDLQGVRVDHHPQPAGVGHLAGDLRVEGHNGKRIRHGEFLEQAEHQPAEGLGEFGGIQRGGGAQIFQEAVEFVDGT